MTPLQEWANANKPIAEIFWYQGYWDQIVFVRDRVARILSSTYEEFVKLVDVDGDHTSKGIKLPVYFINLKEYGIRIWMRNNFHNWNVSVISDRPLTCNFLNSFSDKNDYDYCFCEGMEDKKFSRYMHNKRQFTVCVGDNYDMYVFFRALAKFLSINSN
jgi:hypothetical protein